MGVFMGVALGVATVLIVCTNLLVGAALLRLLLRRSSQSWCFVLNLALADTLLGVAITGLATEEFRARLLPVGPFGAGPSTNETAPALQGKSRCLLRMAFVTSPCMASILSMFLISMDRYAAIKRPLHYSLLCGRGPAAGAVLLLWISSFTIGFLPAMVQQLQARGPYDGVCAFFSVTYDLGVIVLYCVLFFPVLLLFTFMYLDILRIACSHHKQISQNRGGGPGPHPHGPQLKALRTVALLIGCFLVLWGPFFVVCLVHVACERCDLKVVLEKYLWLLGLCNSLANPLVYACWQAEVRVELADMLARPTRRLQQRANMAVCCKRLQTLHQAPPAQTPPGQSSHEHTPPAQAAPVHTPPVHTPPGQSSHEHTPPAWSSPAHTPPAQTPPTRRSPAHAPPAQISSAQTPPTQTPHGQSSPAQTQGGASTAGPRGPSLTLPISSFETNSVASSVTHLDGKVSPVRVSGLLL